ncbi:MAG: type I methionyl aminopeptidase [bacterium]
MTKLIKNQEEIAGIRKSCRKLAKIVEQISQAVRPGVTTIELEKLACKLIEQAGGTPAFKGYKASAKSKPFPTALCTSLNNAIVHCPAIPSKILKQGDIIGIDVGMELDGYYSDMAVTLPVGKISKDAKKLIKITKQALYLGIKQIKPGNSLDNIGRAIQQHVESQGLSVVRDLVGHGVGIDVHEDPQIPHYAVANSGLPDVKLKSGMVLAIEPMVNLGDWRIKTDKDGFTFKTDDDSLSAHFEHTVLVTDKDYEILTYGHR